jgi:hypothetical protein
MQTKNFPIDIVVITHRNVPLKSDFLKLNANIKHLSLNDNGQSIHVQMTCYSGELEVEKIEKEFSSTLMASFQSYIFSEFKHAADTGLLVYSHSEEIYGLIYDPILKSDLPYVLCCEQEDALSLNWTRHHFVSNAIARFCFTAESKKFLQSIMVFDFDLVDSRSLGITLKKCAHRFKLPYESKPIGKGEHKCLLVSYYASPAETVAVHRISYWQENLANIAKGFGEEISVEVMTAYNSYKSRDAVIHIPDKADIDCYDKSTLKLVKKMRAAKVNYFAAYWAAHIRAWVMENPKITFDSVVLSGNPFYYFELADFFKKMWNAKIILDFRDPFANNPRFKYTKAHKKLVCELEDSYLKNADYALSVNQYCLESLRLPNNFMGHVVANGYNEKLLDSVKKRPLRIKDKKISFVYTGSFYADRDAEPFLKSLDETIYKLIHIGRAAPADEYLNHYAALERYGLMSYGDVISYCKSMTAGVIFTSGKLFEQTTKIFDYIAADIDIIILTNGRIKTGELHRLTKDLEGIYWVKNNSKSIAEFLSKYKPIKITRNNREKFSRFEQTKKLYKILTD